MLSCKNTLLIPEEYSVIATLNLNGDYVSDQLAAMVGGIGIAPGANINYKTGHAIFEATHGTAPNIAGKDVVNPCSIILSAVMMLEYLGWKEAAALIEKGVGTEFPRCPCHARSGSLYAGRYIPVYHRFHTRNCGKNRKVNVTIKNEVL